MSGRSMGLRNGDLLIRWLFVMLCIVYSIAFQIDDCCS